MIEFTVTTLDEPGTALVSLNPWWVESVHEVDDEVTLVRMQSGDGHDVVGSYRSTLEKISAALK